MSQWLRWAKNDGWKIFTILFSIFLFILAYCLQFCQCIVVYFKVDRTEPKRRRLRLSKWLKLLLIRLKSICACCYWCMPTMHDFDTIHTILSKLNLKWQLLKSTGNLCKLFKLLLSSADFLLKLTFSKNSFRIKQFGFGCRPTFCQSWSASKLFANVISRWQKWLLATGKH